MLSRLCHNPRVRILALLLIASCQVNLSVDLATNIACASDKDCPTGIHCDSKIGRCDTCNPACGAGQQCQAGKCACTPQSCDGCCLENSCVADVNAQSCGIGGSACASCSGLTPSCQDGACTAVCDASVSCGAGCCAGDGCHPGVDVAACGLSGVCKSCTGNAAGSSCVNGGCGCLTSADCPALFVCNGGQCSAGCSASAPCNNGCCDTNGVCHDGTSPADCGAVGGTCAACDFAAGGGNCTTARTCGCNSANDCASSPAGRVCVVGNVCGCGGPADCPASSTCVIQGGIGVCQPHACGGGSSACTEACCSTDGFCSSTGAPNVCGTGGGDCIDCTAASTGHVCLGGACGCNSVADCPSGTACNNHVCTTDCTGGLTCAGNACCKANLCGPCCTQASDCAASGLTCDTNIDQCVSCSDSLPCASGCCDGGTCRASCSAQASGHVCIAASNPDFCGCNVAADCPAGNVCSTATHKCLAATACNPTDHLCNGCCNAGSCVAACSDTGNNTVCELAGTVNERCGCDSNANCPGAGAPECNVTTNFCVLCYNNTTNVCPPDPPAGDTCAVAYICKNNVCFCSKAGN